MNKQMIHMITLPALIATGVALHVLSYYVEEPPEIVGIPAVPSSEPSKIAAISSKPPEASVKPHVSAKPDTSVKPSALATKKPKPQTEKNPKQTVKPKVTAKPSPVATPKPVVTPVPKPVVTPVPKPTPVIKDKTIEPGATGEKTQLALLISKTQAEIIEEAKIIGGRIDPFLEIKPPPIPEIPDFNATRGSIDTSASIPEFDLDTSPDFDQKIPEPPEIPKFDDTEPGDFDITEPGDFDTTEPDSSDTADTTSPESTEAQTQLEKEVITFRPYAKLREGMVLNGIITGVKPLALITINGENKVYGKGEYIIKDKRIKLVSIDFENQAVTIADNKRRRARLEIEE